MRAIVY